MSKRSGGSPSVRTRRQTPRAAALTDWAATVPKIADIKTHGRKFYEQLHTAWPDSERTHTKPGC